MPVMLEGSLLQFAAPIILETAVDADLRVETHAESSCTVVPAKAGTHAKHLQGLRFLLPWIPAFAGMTVWNLCHTPFTRRVKGHPPARRCFAGHFRVEPVSTAVFRIIEARPA